MAKLRPELRKRLPPFDPTVADDAHIILEAIEARRWIDIEAPFTGPLTDPVQARRHEIQTARNRIMEAALVEYARLYTDHNSVIAERCRAMLANHPGAGYWARSDRVRQQYPASGERYVTTREYHYHCKLCGASIATMSSLAERNGTEHLWTTIRRHTIRCACLLVIETAEQLEFQRRVTAREPGYRGVGRNAPRPPEPRIHCPPPPKNLT